MYTPSPARRIRRRALPPLLVALLAGAHGGCLAQQPASAPDEALGPGGVDRGEGGDGAGGELGEGEGEGEGEGDPGAEDPVRWHTPIEELRCPPAEWEPSPIAPLARGVPEGADIGPIWSLGPGRLPEVVGQPAVPRVFDPGGILTVTLDGNLCLASVASSGEGQELPACFDRRGQVVWMGPAGVGPVTTAAVIAAPNGRLYWSSREGIHVVSPHGMPRWSDGMVVEWIHLGLPPQQQVLEMHVAPLGTWLINVGTPLVLSPCGERIWGIEDSVLDSVSTWDSVFLARRSAGGITQELTVSGELRSNFLGAGERTRVLPVTEDLLLWRIRADGGGSYSIGFSGRGGAVPRAPIEVAWKAELALPDETVVGWIPGAHRRELFVLRPNREVARLQFERDGTEPVLGAGRVIVRAEHDGPDQVLSEEDCRSRLATYDLAGQELTAIDIPGHCFPQSVVVAPDGVAYLLARGYVGNRPDADGAVVWRSIAGVQTSVPGHAPGISRRAEGRLGWTTRDAHSMASTQADAILRP